MSEQPSRLNIANALTLLRIVMVPLFAFVGDEGLSEHTAPFDALVIGVEGRADIVVGGAHHALAAGETLLMPANVPHAINPLEPFKMLLVMLRNPADAAK